MHQRAKRTYRSGLWPGRALPPRRVGPHRGKRSQGSCQRSETGRVYDSRRKKYPNQRPGALVRIGRHSRPKTDRPPAKSAVITQPHTFLTLKTRGALPCLNLSNSKEECTFLVVRSTYL